MGTLVVIAIIVVLGIWLSNKAANRAMEERSIASQAIRCLPSYLRERTGTGPWREMNDYHRLNYIDVKCTRCIIDTIFVCNANPSHETECIDVHFAQGKLRVMYGTKTLFDAAPWHLLSYPQESFPLKRDQPPPIESDFYGPWAKYFNVAIPRPGITQAALPAIQPSVPAPPPESQPAEVSSQGSAKSDSTQDLAAKYDPKNFPSGSSILDVLEALSKDADDSDKLICKCTKDWLLYIAWNNKQLPPRLSDPLTEDQTNALNDVLAGERDIMELIVWLESYSHMKWDGFLALRRKA